MISFGVLMALITQANVSGQVHDRFWGASFDKEPDAIQVKRDHLCDLLFGQSRKSFHSGPYFEDLDSHLNDAALSHLIHLKLKSEKRILRDFESISDQLVLLEQRRGAALVQKQMPIVVDSIDKVQNGLPPTAMRERLLCSECKWLLLGFSHPLESAVELRVLSREALPVSPSISQLALVHSINLFRLSGDDQTAIDLFDFGKQLSLRHVITGYGLYWYHRQPPVPFQPAKVDKTSKLIPPTFDGPHFIWMF